MSVDNTQHSQKEEDYSEKVTYTRLQLEAAKLKAQKLSITQIAERLGKHPQSIQRALKMFEETSGRVRSHIEELRRAGYWKMLRGQGMSSGITQRIGQRWREEKARQGYYVGNPPPLGYTRQGDELVVNPEKARVVKQIFKGWTAGKTLRQLSEETGIYHSEVFVILRNPVYVGMIRRKGQLYPGKHEPIIDKETWNNAQAPKMFGFGKRPHFGYVWHSGRLVGKTEDAAKVREIFKMRAEGKNIAEISKRFGILNTTLRKMIKKRIYLGRKETKEGTFPIEVEQLVDPETWRRAQAVRYKPGEFLRTQGEKKRIKILSFLPATRSRIYGEAGFSTEVSRTWIKKMKKQGIIEETESIIKAKVDFGEWLKTQHFGGPGVGEKRLGIERRLAILRLLPATKKELKAKPTPKVSAQSVDRWLHIMKGEGLIEEDEGLLRYRL